jgi:hypothetical protein
MKIIHSLLNYPKILKLLAEVVEEDSIKMILGLVSIAHLVSINLLIIIVKINLLRMFHYNVWNVVLPIMLLNKLNLKILKIFQKNLLKIVKV